MIEEDKPEFKPLKDFSIALGQEHLDDEAHHTDNDIERREEPIEHIKFSDGNLQIEIYSSKSSIQDLKVILFDILDKSHNCKRNEKQKPYFG